MTTTTFNQVIGDQTFTITVPVKRVEKLVDRIDNLRWLGREAKAIQLLKPFIGAPEIKTEIKPMNINTTDAITDRANKARDLGRYQVIKMLQNDFGVTYQKARNVCIKLNIG